MVCAAGAHPRQAAAVAVRRVSVKGMVFPSVQGTLLHRDVCSIARFSSSPFAVYEWVVLFFAACLGREEATVALLCSASM